LSREFGVDTTVIDSMLQHWVRKGRLVAEAGGQGCRGAGEKEATPGLLLLSPAPSPLCPPASAGCGGCGSCSGASSCPFMARLPLTYRVKHDE
jgi:hypothetical protein